MDLRYIINAAEKLNAYESADDCIAVVSKAIDTNVNFFGNLAEYYDTVVTVFVMAVNKSLYLAPSVEGEEPADHYDAVDNYVSDIRAKFDGFIDNLRGKNGYDDYEVFCDYLKKLAGYICDLTSQAKQTLSDREYPMYQKMMHLIKNDKYTDLNRFTEKYGIQIPYMYALVHDYKFFNQNAFSFVFGNDNKENKIPLSKDGLGGGTRNNIKNWFRHIKDDRLLKIMKLDGRWGLKYPYYAVNEVIFDAEPLDFDQLLPAMLIDDKNGVSQKDEENNITVPLVPAAPITITMENCMSMLLVLFRQEIYEDLKKDDLIKELERKKAELEKANAELEQARQDKYEIIQEFSHTYKNLSVTQLYEIATKFLENDPTTQEDGKKLLVEYEIKQDLAREIEMVQLKFEDRIDELTKKITESLSDDKTAVTVRDALNVAFRRCLITLFHSTDNLRTELEYNFKKIPGFDINEKGNSFDNNVICGDGVSCADWVSGNLFPLEVTVSPEWKKVRMKKGYYAELLLISILTELIQNVLKYADMPGKVCISFEDDNDILIIKFQNSFSKDTYCRRLKNSAAGLNLKNSVLQILNKAAGYDSSRRAVETYSKENSFTTTVKVHKSLFVKGG